MSESTELMAIPFQVSETEYSVIFVLKDGNLERLKRHDPVIVDYRPMKSVFKGLKLRDISIAYATEEECGKIEEGRKAGRPFKEVLAILMKGFEYRPDLGDHDRGPRLA